MISDQTVGDLRRCYDGNSDVSRRLIAHALDNWSGSVDLLRHNSREIYESVIQRHLLFYTSGCKIILINSLQIQICLYIVPDDDRKCFLLDLAAPLLEMRAHEKTRYPPLRLIVRHLGATHLLKVRSNIVYELIQCTEEQTVLVQVSNNIFLDSHVITFLN